MTDLMFATPDRVQVVGVKPGDTVLVLLPGVFDSDQAARLLKALMLPDGVRMALVHRPEMSADAMPAVVVFRPE